MKENIDVLTNLIKGIKENMDSDISSINDSKLYKNVIYNQINKIVDALIRKLELWKDQQFSSQLQVSVNEILVKYNNEINLYLSSYNQNLIEKYYLIYNFLVELENEIKRVTYLSIIKDKNVVLVGGNGAGKSSFASYLKDSLSDNIIVIPAQKFLFFNLRIDQLHLMDKRKINSIQKENFIRRGRFENKQNVSDYEVMQYTNDLSYLFSRFITVLVNEQIKQEHDLLRNDIPGSPFQDKKDNTILYKLNSIWENLIPDIKFEIDTLQRVLIPIKEGEKYTLNAMSDGEKAMLYYISYVLLAEPKSFIVVDEPETFLNASNFNRLWDALEAFRPDCKYIYISHVVDFIVSRTNTDLLWCKNFNYPNNWEIEPIYDESELNQQFPRELLSELLGARKNILFCEGEKSSLDYTIYSSLFKDEVIVYPVGGHNQVIQYTRSYNGLSTQFNGSNAMGIIDADLMDNKQIESYERENIYTLNFNEIEMLLLTDEVMIDVLQYRFSGHELNEKITTFKLEFLKEISGNIEKVIFEKTKKYMDTSLSNYRINTSTTPEQISEEVSSWLGELNVVEESKKFETEIKKLIQDENYEKLLELCPLKGRISKGLANNFLDHPYVDRALNRIKCNELLSKDLRSKYFKM